MDVLGCYCPQINICGNKHKQDTKMNNIRNQVHINFIKQHKFWLPLSIDHQGPYLLQRRDLCLGVPHILNKIYYWVLLCCHIVLHCAFFHYTWQPLA